MLMQPKLIRRPALRVVSNGFGLAPMILSDYPISEQVAILLAVAGNSLGGVRLKSCDGAVSQQWLQHVARLRQKAGLRSEVHRMPVHCGFEELVGGLDIIASLTQPATTMQPGLLARADCGLLVLPHAGLHRTENIRALCVALDTRLAPDMSSASNAKPETIQQKDARLCVIALTNAGLPDSDEQIDDALLDRLAFSVELELSPNSCLNLELTDLNHAGGAGRKEMIAADADSAVVAAIEVAYSQWSTVRIQEDHLKAICSIAQSLGISSARPLVLCLNVARCIAALSGRQTASEDDIDQAMVLCFPWRAQSLPATEQAGKEQSSPADKSTQSGKSEPSAEQVEETENSPQDHSGNTPGPEQSRTEDTTIDINADEGLHDEEQNNRLQDQPDRSHVPGATVEPETAVMPVGLLNALTAKNNVTPVGQGAGQSAGRSGKPVALQQRGRLIGTERYRAGSGQKINILATLRKAAPWQKLRRQQRNCAEGWQRPLIYPHDIQASRYLQATQTVAIFVVDASGSAAARRLAEAKGAIELLLTECYVRRDEVALIVFQGAAATLVLPPTRSLVRARRELAKMPAGGGTPLADGLALANTLCADVRRSGNTPILCLLTDGRANVDRDGIGGRALAMQHALQTADLIRQSGVQSLLIDIATRPSTFAGELATAIGAQYEAMPRADAARISSAVSASSGPASTGNTTKTRRAG